MMGGDYAPLEAVKGVALFLKELKTPARLFLFGDEQVLAPLLEEHKLPTENITLVHAPQVIGMHEHPTKALKEKQQSSIEPSARCRLDLRVCKSQRSDAEDVQIGRHRRPALQQGSVRDVEENGRRKPAGR